MGNFLLELLSEEIPSSDQKLGRAFLQSYFTEKLDEFKLSYSEIETYSSPRRITAHISGIAQEAELVKEERRGPRVDSPERALAGFLKANGVHKSELKIKDIKGINYYFLESEIKGEKGSVILENILESMIKNFKWRKSMRWGTSRFRWIRPLRSILALQYQNDQEANILELTVGRVKASDKTVGHSFMRPEEFSVTSFDTYEKALRDNFVEFDHQVRQRQILDQLDKLTEDKELVALKDEHLIEEVSGLVEWPTALMGEINDEFLDLPSEILQTVMILHQRYFPVKSVKTNKIVKYITIANILPEDKGKQILVGNNRVLNSRLADAKFFWELDKQKIDDHGFESFSKALGAVTFFRGLGSQAERVTRIAKVAQGINERLYGLPLDQILLAANVCKGDLVSGTVKEFPELQGVAGGYFAKMSGLSDAVCFSCKDHYSPIGPFDKVPTRNLSVTIGLADKIDLLSSFWSINEKPTGSKDPFGLRRAAIGIIRLISENEIDITLSHLFEFSDQNFDSDDISKFIVERLRIYMKTEGVRGTTFDACEQAIFNEGIFSFIARAKALEKFLDLDDGQILLQLSKRALNILVSEEKKDGVEYSLSPQLGDSLEFEEVDLINCLHSLDRKISNLVNSKEYSEALALLTTLHPMVNRFFEKIQINSENDFLRRNRLCTLGFIRSMLEKIADFRILE